MSLEATISTWKLTKEQVTPTEKLFLLSCADRAGEEGIIWPSLKRLMADTGLDRKTIIAARQSTIDKKLLRYTGEYKGRTKSIPVMQLTYIIERHPISDPDVAPCEPETPTASPKTSSPKNGTALTTSSPKNGTAKQSQKRDTESLIYNLSFKNEPKAVVDEKILELATKAKIKPEELEALSKDYDPLKIEGQLKALILKTGIVNPLAWLITSLKKNYTHSEFKAPTYKPASYEAWNEMRYAAECREREQYSDPNDWRDLLFA